MTSVIAAMWKCCQNADSTAMLVEAQGITTLTDIVSMTVTFGEGVTEQVCGALRNCCKNSQLAREQVRAKGGIETLCSLLRKTNPSLLENVMGALWAVCLDPQARR